ncbi:MAG: PAS domain S-box protein, partial [bacterium]
MQTEKLRNEVQALRKEVARLERAYVERDQAYQALLDREVALRKLYNIAGDAIFIIDGEKKRIIDANPKASELLEYSQKELRRMPIKRIHPNEMKLFNEFWDILLTGTVVRRDDLTCTSKSGKIIPIELSAARLPFKGHPYLLAIVRDITRRKLAENALLERQTRLELLNDIAIGISSDVSAEEVIKRVVRKISGYFRTLRIAYSIIDEQGSGRVVYSKQPKGMKAMSGVTINLKKAPEYLSALHRRELVIVEDVCRDSRLLPLCQELAAGKASAILDIPVQHSDKLVGLLGFASSVPRKWSDHEITTLKEVADYLSIAIKDSEIQMKRTEAEQALRHSEKRYQTLAEVSPVGISHSDAYGNCFYVNQQWCRITGMKFEDALGAGWMQSLHPADKDSVVREWRESMKAKTPFKMEYRLVNPEGLPVWVLAQAVAEQDKSGKVVGYVGSITDITDRKRIEEALRENETHTRVLIEAIPDMMFQLAKDGTYLDFIPSDECEPLVPPSQFLGKNISEAMPPDIAEQAMVAINKAFATGKPQILEYTLTKDKETRDYEARIVVNGVDRVLAIVRNITTRKKAEAALRESEEKYRTLVQNSNEAIFVVQNGKVRFFNARAMELTGYSSSDLKAMEYRKLIHSGDQSILDEQLKNSVFDKKASIPNCLRVLDKSGATKWIEL